MTKQLLLARHASTEATYRGAFAGRLDLPLGPDAEAEINHLAEAARSYRPTAIVCSSMVRARETAQGVAARLGLPARNIRTLEGLREIDFGRWEGLTFAEIEAAEPEMVQRWAEWSEEFRFPEGEQLGVFLERVGETTTILSAEEDETILVVTHGGVLRAMLCRLLGLAARHYLLFDVQPAGLAVIRLFGELGVLRALYPGRRTEG